MLRLPKRSGLADDQAGEAITLDNIGLVLRDLGRLDESVAHFKAVVELDRQLGHPDLESDTAFLHQLQDELRQRQPSQTG